MNKFLDAEEVRRWHRVFKHDNGLFEIRILGEGKLSLSGYFLDVEKALQCIEPYDRQKTFQIYFSVNEVNPACSSRTQFEQFLRVDGSATSKRDITRRTWIPIDVDVERPSKISSTDEEKEYAHQKAGNIYRFLQENGFEEPVVCDSSSGYHIYYAVDLPNTDDIERLIKDIYEILDQYFTDDKVKIDSAVGDANRIMRLPGTWGRKGRDSDERPHRICRILSVPDEIKITPENQLRGFIEKHKLADDNNRRYSRSYDGDAFDLRSFISKHGIRVAYEAPFGKGGTKFVLEECPFDGGHKAPDAALFLLPSGAVDFKCLHDSCSRYEWKDFRLLYEPEAYTYQSYQPQGQRRQYGYGAQPKPKYEIKEVAPELGEKWLTMQDIEKVDILRMPKVKTGFSVLDKALLGLFFNEVTLLSGSNSSGKTSWLNTLILNIIQQNQKCALWSGEMPAYVLKSWIQMAAAGKNNLLRSNYAEGKYWVPNNVSTKIDQWLSNKLFIYNNEYGNTWQQLFHDMGLLLDLGVSVFILDNLFSMNIDLLEGDKNNQQRELILQIKDFAKKNKVHIILVAHPRKAISFLRKNDISGTSDLTNAVDNVFIIHRVNNDFTKAGADFFGAGKISQYDCYDNVIEICKNRQFGVVDLLVGMYYEPESRRFKNYDYEEIHYNWESEPVQAEMSFNDEPPKPFDEPDDKEYPF